MKVSKLVPTTKKAGIITIAVVSGLVVGGLGVTRSEAAMDWLGLEQKLTNHDEQLNNHDDRITNVENDVEKVQEETQTAPSSEKVVVREVVTENPTVQNEPEAESDPAPAPKPVVVTAFEQVPVDANRTDCKYTFSDGTTKTTVWKVTSVNAQGHQNSSYKGYCESLVIGWDKKYIN